MLNFQRIICIWICCVSCMFGTTQLSTLLVQAVPYEYFDDHDQSFYDLDTEQIQAKYDTRLLSQQMLPTENLKGFHNSATMTAFNDGGGADGHRSALDRKQNNAGALYGSTVKLKSNDGSAATSFDGDDNDDDDDDDDNINNDWLEQKEKTVTMTASSTSAFTEPLDELRLPRAASCFTNGQKYTHGQKVPRLDNCEVCLCMDGEIFCWWEKCDKKSAKASTTYDDFSTPFEESSTTRMQLKPKTTFKTTLKPMKKPTTTKNQDYKYDDDDSAEIREMQQEYEGFKEQLLRDEHKYEQESQKQVKTTRNMQMVKKKIYQQQQEEEEKHKKKIKEPNQNRKQQQQQQQKQLKSNEHYEQHHHVHNHNSNNNNNNNNRHHDKSSSGSSSKILNFPENLPSVLYYDYKTEEHHQHQHQHREQHLKHQKQKQQQHEKELKQRQQQKLLQQQQQQREQQSHHNNHHHEYGQDFHTYKSPNGLELGMLANDGGSGPSTTFKYFSNGNENIFNEDLQTDSDILPEPPTKKPKFLTSIADTTGTPLSQLYRLSTVTTAAAAASASISTTLNGKLTKPATILTSSIPLKKQILSSWDSDKQNSDKENGNGNNNSNSNSQSTTNNESTEDLMDTEDQDDAFHRWLTSTETNNKNNFTLKETASGGREGANEVGSRGFDGSNSDYNGDEKIYENIGFDTNTGLSSTIGNTDNTVTAMATGSTKNTEAAVASIYDDNDLKANGMLYENIQHFNDNNRLNGNSNGIINDNGYVSNYNSAFSQTYQNSNKNNNQLNTASGSSSDSGGRISSTTSNEDNSVASVVNIDIMLTASSAETLPINQQQQQLEQQLQNFEHEKQIAKTHDIFMQAPHLISNTNDAAAISVVDNNHRLSLIEKDNDNSYNKDSNFTNIVAGGNSNKEIQNMGVNLPNNNNRNSINNTNNNNNNSATSYSSSSSSDSFKFKNSPTTNTTSSTASTAVTSSTALTTPPTLSTTSSPERQCNVMGTLYKIGDVLPQDTGNCLQCICIDGSTSDDTPRVTCSPHNCPPLVLPDLFDATGY